jgi:hypothetical protein
MRLSLPLVAGVLVLALSACSTTPADAPSADPTDGPSGITGIVLVGPECRRPSEASPCLVPYQARLVILDPDGRIVGDVTSGPDGSFRLELPPGDYIIQPSPGGDPYPRAEARSVTVVAGELSEVEIDYERGRG